MSKGKKRAVRAFGVRVGKKERGKEPKKLELSSERNWKNYDLVSAKR